MQRWSKANEAADRQRPQLAAGQPQRLADLHGP
jgi:hypothetical protein